MIQRVVICNRCGAVVKEERPVRITIHKPVVTTYTDHWGKEHQRKEYKTDKTIHLCSNCQSVFNSVLANACMEVVK